MMTRGANEIQSLKRRKSFESNSEVTMMFCVEDGANSIGSSIGVGRLCRVAATVHPREKEERIVSCGCNAACFGIRFGGKKRGD